jgi:hypothetical protein
MRGSSGRSSEGRRLGRPLRALAALTALLAFLAFSSSAMASSPPVIESESVSHISEHDATLEAQIETGGLYTGYWFQIDTNSSYHFTQAVCPFEFPGDAQCESIVAGEPLPPGLVEPQPQYIPAGSGDQSVSVDLASIGATLQPDTTYHYRVLASTGGSPTVQGPDQTFTTPSAGTVGTAPSIDSDSVSGVTEHDATLEAQINTEGLETSYQFHLWAICGGKGACLVVINYPLPSGNLLGSFVDQSVSLDLNAAGVTLQPGGTYFYSVSATSVAGTTESPTQRFTTPENIVQPLSTTTSTLSGAGQPAGANGGDQPAVSGGSSSSPTSAVQSSPDSVVVKTTKLEPLPNARKLAKALEQCRKEPKRKRGSCEKRAHQKYASVAEKSRRM